MKHCFSDLGAFRRDPLTFLLEKGAAASEPLVRLRLGPSPVFLVAEPALVKPMMKEAEAKIDKGKLIHKLRAIVGRSSLTISGLAHRARREVIHRQLARGIAAGFVPQITAVLRQFAAHVARTGSIDAHASTAPLALRIIASALFGHGVLSEADQGALVKAVKLVEDDLAAGMFNVLPPDPVTWLRRRRRLALAREIMTGIVQRTRQKASASSLMHSLEGLTLTDEEMRDEVLMILLAGHHTTGTAAAWLLYHLAVDPRLCNAVAAEAATVADEAGEILSAKLAGASLSLAVVREVLRLYPSAWWFSREVKAPLDLGGRRLQKGTSLIVSPWGLHRDPRFWLEPDCFDPLRQHNVRAYMPFGVGPRACVGMGMAMLELQLIALEMASAFTMTVTSAVPAPRPSPSITLLPSPIEIAFTPRLRAAVPSVGSTQAARFRQA